MEKYKSRFVARGFSQKEGEDNDKTFSPVAKYTSIRAVVTNIEILAFGHLGE